MNIERMKVGRRAFLALGAGVTGGCIQDGAPGGNETTVPSGDPPTRTDKRAERTEVTATNRPETDSATTVRGDVTIGIDSDRSEPQTTETISRANGRNQFDDEDTIFVWNDADTARRIGVIVEEKETSDEPLFRETYRFEPDAYITLDVSKSGEYSITIGLDGNTLETVDFVADDCNDQSFFVTIEPDGSVRSSGIGTAMGCMTVQPATQ